jgi:hypothetical protein
MSPTSEKLAPRQKQSSRLRGFVITTTVVIFFFAAAWWFLSGPPGELRPSVRPAGVPRDAVWAGGADGGAYVRCLVDRRKNADHCEVWNDNTGDLAESGDYQIEGQARAATAQELKAPQGSDFGGHIYLENGIVLDRLQP